MIKWKFSIDFRSLKNNFFNLTDLIYLKSFVHKNINLIQTTRVCTLLDSGASKF